MDVSLLTVLAQAGNDPFGGGGGGGEAAGAAFGIVFMLVYLAIIVICIAGMWATFAKAGKPGWAAIVPIYQWVVMLEIAGKPMWWLLIFLFCTPVAAILVSIAIAERFGQGAGFGIGLAFLPFIFFPILGFGAARYLGVPAQGR